MKDFIQEIQNEYIYTKEERMQMIENIRSFVKDYVSTNNLQSLVIGVSGGLDSAVVSALCQEKYTGVPLIGVSIPMSSTNDHKEKADWVGEKYCTAYEEFKGFEERVFDTETSSYIPFNDSFFNILERTDKLAKKAGFKTEEMPKNILQGNVKARIRMITLYDLARKTNGIVLSTDQLSEEAAGFWTLHGDVGDLSPIQKLWKGLELWQIAEELGVRDDIITQAPSDGLGVTEDNTDEAQLGMDYKTFDSILAVYFYQNGIEKGTGKFNIDTLVNFTENVEGTDLYKLAINRYNSTKFKRDNPVVIPREMII